MNIMTRFKWPVMIAAGLHGALFVSLPSDYVPPPHVKKVDPPLPTLPISTEIPEVAQSDPDPGGASGSDSVLSLPDMPAPPDLRNPFEIPEITRAAPDKTITDLTRYRGDFGHPDGIGGPGSFKGPAITGVTGLDRVPRAMAQPAPVYPHAMRQDGVTGDVTVEFIVGTDGSVISAQAIRWSRREFVDAAVNAVLKWRFEPGTVNGRKVRFRMAIPIEFYATK